MEPSFRDKLRIVFLGILLPFVLFATIHAWISGSPLFSIHGMYAHSFQFWRKLKAKDLDERYPPVDLLVIGDSATKTAISPSAFDKLFVVNTASNHGTSMTASFALESYLESYPAPKCVLLHLQLNWRRNTQNFIPYVMPTGIFDARETEAIWRMGEAGNAYPSTDYSHIGFHFASLRARLWLHEFQIGDIQNAVLMRRPYRTNHRSSQLSRQAPDGFWRRVRSPNLREEMNDLRGYQPISENTLLSDEDFFNDNHVDFDKPFHPDASEDYYLRRIAKTAEAKNIRLIYTSGPTADSAFVDRAREFLEGRERHFDEVMREFPSVIKADLPKTLPRALFYDFTHLNRHGAIELATLIESQIKSICRQELN